MSRARDPKVKSVLLGAAEEAFAEHGLLGADVQDITKRVGLPLGAFYLHFESKEAALDEIVETWIARCASLFAAPSEYPDPPTDADAVLDFVIERDVRIYEFLWQSRTTMRVLNRCQGKYAFLFESFRQDMQRRSREWLARWRQDGLLRLDADGELSAALMSGAHEELSRKIVASEQRPPIEHWLQLTQEFFVRALGTPDLIAALQRRNRRATTGIHDLPWSALASHVDGFLPRLRVRDRG